MIDFSVLLSQGGVAPWFSIPTAILLGALHGLEPGHSKTMTAAFIVAIRGAVGQASDAGAGGNAVTYCGRLAGGLIPCPAVITIVLLCLQKNKLRWGRSWW